MKRIRAARVALFLGFGLVLQTIAGQSLKPSLIKTPGEAVSYREYSQAEAITAFLSALKSAPDRRVRRPRHLPGRPGRPGGRDP
jgi:hypothetical protein